jgi:hypothetical protein
LAAGGQISPTLPDLQGGRIEPASRTIVARGSMANHRANKIPLQPQRVRERWAGEY